MQPDKNIDDLDYLAELGYEKMHLFGNELPRMKQFIRSRSFSNNDTVFYFSLFCTALFFGISLLLYFEKPRKIPAATKAQHLQPNLPVIEDQEKLNFPLDTMQEQLERFFAPVKNQNQGSNQKRPEETQEELLVEPLAAKSLPINSEVRADENLRIKTTINSPVIYIHNMKVSDYAILYFRGRQRVPTPGIPANFSDKQDMQNLIELADKAYLHEELSSALLLFKKEKFIEALQKFRMLKAYNSGDINAAFYTGMCNFNLGRYVAAETDLHQAETAMNNAFAEEAAFYRAQCLIKTGQTEAGFEKLKGIAESDGFYSAKARDFLK